MTWEAETRSEGLTVRTPEPSCISEVKTHPKDRPIPGNKERRREKSVPGEAGVWQGRLDSNQRMRESKSLALPLGYTPIKGR